MSVLSTLAHQQHEFSGLVNDMIDLLDEEDTLAKEAKQGLMRDGGPIDLSTFGTESWLEFFRFTKSEVDSLIVALDLPEYIHCDNGISEPAQTALPMLLRRLAYPARYSDISQAFGWEKSRFSRITRTLAIFIYKRWSHILYFDHYRLNPVKLAEYASAVHHKGAALPNAWGFVDGTLRRTARPVRNQRIVYNGWKRIHALKFHSVVTPDGLHSHLFGPIEGRRHDETVYKQSNLDHLLHTYSHAPNGLPLVIYGDPAYGLSRHLISPFKGSQLTADQIQFNSSMSKVREAVEWGFGEVIRQFAFLDFYKNQKVLLQPVGILYVVGILFCNAHVILHGSQVSSYFDCLPPTLEEYFRGSAEDALEAQSNGRTVNFSGISPGVDVLEEDLGDGEEFD